MDVAVAPEGRLLARRSGRGVGHGRAPDVAPFMALADGFDGQQVRPPLGQRANVPGQLIIGVVVVERQVVAHDDSSQGFLAIRFGAPVGVSCASGLELDTADCVCGSSPNRETRAASTNRGTTCSASRSMLVAIWPGRL